MQRVICPGPLSLPGSQAHVFSLKHRMKPSRAGKASSIVQLCRSIIHLTPWILGTGARHVRGRIPIGCIARAEAQHQVLRSSDHLGGRQLNACHLLVLEVTWIRLFDTRPSRPLISNSFRCMRTLVASYTGHGALQDPLKCDPDGQPQDPAPIKGCSPFQRHPYLHVCSHSPHHQQVPAKRPLLDIRNDLGHWLMLTERDL